MKKPIVIPKYLPPPYFPVHPRDATDWDRFWTEFLKGDYLDNDFERNEAVANVRFSDYDGSAYRRYLEQFEQRRYQRILFVGNGLGMLPRVFAHRGFQVQVIDFSEVANHYCRQNPGGDRLAYRFFNESSEDLFIELRRLSDEQLRDVLDPRFLPGGSVDYTTVDVFECHFPESHFDAIVMQNTAEHYDAPERQMLARRLFGWLRPRGSLVVESQYLTQQTNGIEVEEGIEEDFVVAGFFDTLREFHRWEIEEDQFWQARKREVRHSNPGHHAPWSDTSEIGQAKLDRLDAAYEQEWDQRLEQAQLLGLQRLAEGAKEVIFQICR